MAYMIEANAQNLEAIKAERTSGARVVDKRGYDVIRNAFFVREKALNGNPMSSGNLFEQEIEITFNDFKEYREYLDNDIYSNACYYQLNATALEQDIDFERLFSRSSFTNETLDDYTLNFFREDMQKYKEGERKKKRYKNWIREFCRCSTLEELQSTQKRFRKTKLCAEDFDRSKSILFWSFIWNAVGDEKKTQTIMSYMSSKTCAESYVRELCTVLDPDMVVAGYKPQCLSFKKQKRRLRLVANAIKDGKCQVEREAFFDPTSHFYCERICYVPTDTDICAINGRSQYYSYRYFDTIEDLIQYRKGDLTNTDLSYAVYLNYDFSKCKTDSTTIFPIKESSITNYTLNKEYRNQKFYVRQKWFNDNHVLIWQYNHTFDLFCDFAVFLKGDLSGADLLFCDGLQNLHDISHFNLTDAKLSSTVCDKLGIQYRPIDNNEDAFSFPITAENEQNTEAALANLRKEENPSEIAKYCTFFKLFGKDSQTRIPISYISDIHLSHQIVHSNPKSATDIEYVIRTIAERINEECAKIVLIGGDVSSKFCEFKMFVQELRRCVPYNKTMIFVLGNHELWDFPNMPMSEITATYEKLLSENGMYLLHNNALLIDCDSVSKITTDELIALDKAALQKAARTARIVVFGGLGFSGYNEEFNANNGIYRQTISRNIEIEETKKFEKLYEKARYTFSDKGMIVLTHMPMQCWARKEEYQKGFVYVSGHTHKNAYYDDGRTRIYADNQIGYKSRAVHMKWFDVNAEYDYFSAYQDGIYVISADEYKAFYRGMSISMTFTRKIHKLYMLKKDGYYCFIHESENGLLTIMNGGLMTSLASNDINYYYDNMDFAISQIQTPMSAYTTCQKKVAAEIQAFGGSGRIHGCIIDIDFCNHVFVNPEDGKLSGYWADDMIHKLVYPTIPALLEAQCPTLYANYRKLLNGSPEKVQMLTAQSNSYMDSPEYYPDTIMYRISKTVMKMQRLESRILTLWYEQAQTGNATNVLPQPLSTHNLASEVAFPSATLLDKPQKGR